MTVRSIRKHSSVKLEWIDREFYLDVRSDVTRVEQMLKALLKNQMTIQKTWREMEKMHHFSAWNPIFYRGPLIGPQ